MAIACIRRESESSDKVIGRWRKKVRAANLVKEVRKARYFERNDSRTKKKEGAVVREKYRAKRRAQKFYA